MPTFEKLIDKKCDWLSTKNPSLSLLNVESLSSNAFENAFEVLCLQLHSNLKFYIRLIRITNEEQ